MTQEALKNDNRIHYIYRITNVINNKIYIGQTVQPNKRWNQHKNDSASPNQIISKAIKKYGNTSFEFEILATCKGWDNANNLETLIISQYNSLVPNGYNVSLGGINAPKSDAWKQSMKDWRDSLTQEEKDSINEKHRQATILYQSKNGHPSLGKKRSDEQLAQMSQTRLNNPIIYTDEVRKNMSEAHLGHKDSEETKLAKSEAQKERWVKLNKERELKEDIRCFAPGCDIVGTGNKYKIINGIRYCNKHGLRLLRYNRLETLTR